MTDVSNKRCPFCNGVIRIGIVDGEFINGKFNLQDEAYEKNPTSGLGYVLLHEIDVDTAGNYACPIAHLSDSFLGCHAYECHDEALEVWNDRHYSWTMLMDVIDVCYPPELFVAGKTPSDIGPQIIVKLREIDELRQKVGASDE